jgi:septum formation protein
MRTVILASASERRSRILTECGIKHKIMASGVEETNRPGVHISETVKMHAKNKAASISRGVKDAIVIGADTLVADGTDILGKPDSETSAREMLKRFSGASLEVYTGLCVIDTVTRKAASSFDRSSLKVIPLAESDIEKYFRLLAPYDKAGGFSIEGAGSLIFDNIEGSYFNILGLPMIKLAELFREIELDIVDFIDSNWIK